MIQLNELVTIRPEETIGFDINGVTIPIKVCPTIEEIATAVHLVSDLITMDTNPILFPPIIKMLSDLFYIKTVTNIDLEFLIAPEVPVSRIYEAYDVLFDLIAYIKRGGDTAVNYYNIYNSWVEETVEAIHTYRNSARGIVDALSESNILQQQTMLEDLQDIDKSKLVEIIDLIGTSGG